MRELELFTVDTPYRRPLPVRSWTFGAPEENSLAIVAALRGNEIQQMYVCSLLIQSLAELGREVITEQGFCGGKQGLTVCVLRAEAQGITQL